MNISKILDICMRLYHSVGWKMSDLKPELESQEYGAHTFKVESRNIKFRVAKITPTKAGQFVTFWKRNGRGPILPHDSEDPFDFLIIAVLQKEKLGHFVFPKSLLTQQDIISNAGQGGKRALRVYPPWDVTLNKQAQTTQKWQTKYFLDLSEGNDFNSDEMKRLYSL